MPNANDIAEQVKLLTSLDTARSLRELNRDLANLPRQTRTNSSSSAGSQSDPAQIVGEDGLTDADRFGLATIDDLYKGFDLSNDQAYASRLSGELEATIDYQIANRLRDAQLASGGELTPEVAGLTRARDILAQQADEFRATVPEAVDFRTIPEERRKDLASPDGFKGNLLKAGATALAGIPGLAGIAASAIGFEDAGQALGGIASDIREAAPTDIGSSAASQLSSDIIRRAGLEEDDPERMSLGEASREIAKLALTDGDFAADLLGSTVGATAGGGVVRAGASGAARLTGLAGTRAGQAAGRAAGTSAGQAAPAIGVGLGSGVDENLTTEQARLLAGTGAASAGLAGLTGALGGQVAESALGNLGRAVTGRGAQATAQAADDLTVATGRQIAGNAARQLPASAVGEAAQEFVESGGEALGEFSQEQGTGVLETLASPDARRQGLAAGATGAAIGGIVGAGASAPSSVAGDLRSNRVNRAETARRADNAAALDQQRQSSIAANRQAEVDRIQAQNDELNAAAQFADAANQNVVNQAEAREAARVAREEAIESRREQLRAPVAPDPSIDREALSIAELNRLEQAEAEGVPQTLEDFITNTAAASSTLREFLSDGDLETDFRALYRNQVAQNGAELDPDQEEAFINALADVDFEQLAPAEIGPVIEQAAQDAQLTENIEAVRTQRQQEQEAADLERVEQARLASEAAAQEAANAETEANLTSRNEAEQARVAQEEADTQAAQSIVSEAFTNSVASVPAVTGLDTSPAQRNSARLPTIDNTLVAAREQGDGSAQALDVIDLQTQLVEQANTGVPRQVFKQLATNSGFNEEQSTAFGARMASALRDNQTTAQLIETAERYQSVLRDGTVSVGPITGADIREQFRNVIRSFPGARDTFRQEGERGLLVKDSERDALVQEATQARIQRGLNLDPEVSTAIQESISLLETASTQTEPLSAEQAAEVLNARDLLQYEVEQARSEATIRRQASARQGVNTRARNAAAREERNTDTDFSDDLDILDRALDPASEIESSSSQTRGDRFFTGAGDGNVTVREDQAETLQNYTSNRSPLFQELTPSERQSFSGTVTRARTKIRNALKKEGPLTPAEAKGVLDAVEKIDGAIAAKKPSALAEGQTNSAVVNPYEGKEGEHLQGLPDTVQVDGREVRFTGLRSAEIAAEQYMASVGREYTPPKTYAAVDVARATRIAKAYEEMEHAPDDPEVKAAYAALRDETYAQYQAMLDQGVVVEFNNGSDPYGNPRNAILDVVENNHMFVFPTDEGFGSTDTEFPNHPLLEKAPFKFGDRDTVANDIFRAVHDYFGHIKSGVGFRARGEENAWRNHAAMYSPLARRAITAETRGQNSWVNFGPLGEQNRTASGADTVFADPKAGLMPDWTLEDGEIDFLSEPTRYKKPPSESRAIPTPTQEQVSEQSDRDSSGADKAAELTVPNRVVFNPSANPDLVDARDIPDQELTQVKKDAVSGGKQEGKFQSNDDRKQAFDSVGYEGNSNDNLSPAAINQIFETYSRSIPKVGVMESVTNYVGAHFRGAVALSDNLFFGSKKRPLRSTRARIARILAHELGHASHSLLGDVLNSDPDITAELAPEGPVERLLYEGLRAKVDQAPNPDAKFFNYVLSANEMLAEFNVFRFNNPELAQQRAPALTRALGSVENAENLIITRKSFPGLLGRPQPIRRRLSSSRNPDNSIEVFKRTDALEESNPERDSISLIASRPYTRQRVLAARAASIGQTPTGVRRYMAKIAGSRRSREAAGNSSVFSNIDLQAVERSALLALEGRLPINRVRTSRTTPVTVGVARTPTSQGLLPRASQSEAPRQFSTSDVDGVVNEIMSNWGKKPRVVIVESTSDLPAELQTGATVAGITDGSTAYLVADQFVDNDHIAATLAEELFHKGLSKSLGLNYNSRLDSVFRSRGRVPGLLKLARDYGSSDLFEINYADVIAAAQAGNKEAQRELTDEVLARIAQSPDLPTGVVAQLKQIQSRIKRYVQRFFPQVWQDSVTLADIHLMIREANNAGRDNDYQGPVRVRAARSSKPGDYYVLDKDGNKQVKHFYTGETSPAPELVRDTKELATNTWTSLSDKVRSKTLRDAVYKSTPWEKLMIGMANGKFLIERVETELRRATSKQVNKMMEDLRSEEVPELVSKIFAKYTNESQDRALMSVNSAITRYASSGQYKARAGGLAVNENGDSMAEAIGRVGESLTAIQAYFDLSPEQAQSQLSRYSNALHASERNDIGWLMNADLQDSESTAERRLLRAEAAREGWSPALLNELRTLVEENAIDAREDYVGSGMSDAQAAEVLSDLRQNEQGAALLQEAHEKIQELIQATNEVKRQTGSFSNSYQAAIDAFGWKNYVPLRGRGIDPDEDIGSDFASAGFNNVHSETFRAFQGRESLVEDVVETVQRQAISAIEQNAFQDVMESVVAHNVGTGLDSYTEVFQRDGSGGKRFEGEIQQMEINSAAFKNLMAQKDPRRLVYYNSDNQGARLQNALVVTFARKEDAEALAGIKNDTADKLEAMLHEFKPFAGYSVPQATQFMASLKTSRNPPFIPFDALRNMLTLGYVASTEEGLTGLNAYIRQFTQPGLGNYTRDIAKYVRRYQNGDRKGLQDLVANDGPGSTVAELDEFFRLGGPTSFLAALRDNDPNALSNLTGLASRANRAEVALKKLDNALITANVVADTLSRFAFYKALKDQGVDPRVAAARAKNTANFEQRGSFSGPLGGVLEFFRPTATGASALINSTLTGEYGPQTMAAGFGAGIALYTMASLMAGVDDEGEDVLANVNGKLYNNNFVFQYGDEPSDRVQVGIGFGPVASAISSGAQVARFMLGHQSINDTVDNVTGAIAGQAALVPLSQISPTENPTGFVANSVTPSLLKPIFEVGRNLNSLGIPIRSEFPGSDAGGLTGSFEGRLGSEQEMYDAVTQSLRNAGIADINPDNFKHVMRSYASGITYMMETMYENAKYAASDEEFIYNKKAGLYPFRQFIGSEFSQTPQDFYNHYNRVGALKTLIKRYEQAGREDKAEEIRQLPIYAENISDYDAAFKALRNVNKPYRPILKLDETSTAEARRANRQRNKDRDAIYKKYLKAVES